MGEYKVKEIDVGEILKLAKEIYDKNGRLVAINGYVDGQKKNSVAYTFEYESNRETLIIRGETIIPTLTTIYPGGAQWFEEEIEEVMEVKFRGLIKGDRLFLPREFKDAEGQILVMPLDELKKYKEVGDE